MKAPTQPAVVGLDLSLRSTGIAYADGHVRAVPTGKLRGPERLAYIAAEVVGAAHSAEMAVIEAYAFGAQGRSAYALGELGGVVRLDLWRHGVAYWEVSPSALKVFATDNGGAGKATMAAAARARLGYLSDQDDEADALWLRALGLAALGFHVTADAPNERQAAVVAAVAAQRPTWGHAGGRPMVTVPVPGRLL